MRRSLIPLALAASVVLALDARAPAVQAPDGHALYLKNCRTCHGATGEPSAQNKHKYPKIKTLADPVFMDSIPDDSILHVIRNGVGKDMKAFKDRLTPAEIDAVAKYVRTLALKNVKEK